MDKQKPLLLIYGQRLLEYCMTLAIALLAIFLTLFVARSNVDLGWLVILGILSIGVAILVRARTADKKRLVRGEGAVVTMMEETRDQAELRRLRTLVLRNAMTARGALLASLVALYIACGGLRLPMAVQIPLAVLLLILSAALHWRLWGRGVLLKGRWEKRAD